MNEINVVWIFVDSVRRYHSTGDDRSRLNIMDEFGAESVEFINAVTSAPSTYMSISAMLTGMSSYYISINFDDFMFDETSFASLYYDLRNIGYHSYILWMSKESRETMLKSLPVIDHRYWPKDFKYNDWWDNSKINTLLDNVLSKGVKTPSFFFVNYN